MQFREDFGIAEKILKFWTSENVKHSLPDNVSYLLQHSYL